MTTGSAGACLVSQFSILSPAQTLATTSCSIFENILLPFGLNRSSHSLPSNICQIQATLLAQHHHPLTDSRTVRQKTRWRKGWRSQSHPFWAVFAPFRTIFAPFCAVSDCSESFSDRFERRTLRKVRENSRKLAKNSRNVRENSRIACFTQRLHN